MFSELSCHPVSPQLWLSTEAQAERQASPQLLSQRVTMQTHLGHNTQLPWELAYGGCALICVWLPLSGHGTYQQNCKRREFKPRLESLTAKGSCGSCACCLEEDRDPGDGLVSEAGKGLGILQRQGSAPGVGAKQSSRLNLSAAALWHLVVAPFLLAIDREISAHPRALCAV